MCLEISVYKYEDGKECDTGASSSTKSSFAMATTHLSERRDQHLHHTDMTVISRSYKDTIHFGTTVSAARAERSQDTFTQHESKHWPPFPPELPSHKTTVSCVSSLKVDLPGCFTANSSVMSEIFYFFYY